VNPQYIDKNYSEFLIIWDKMFGSFEPEEEEVCYGVTHPPKTWHPISLNFQFWRHLWHDAKNTSSYWDKIRIWFMPTGWRPADVAERYPLARCLPDTQQKFDNAPPASVSLSVVMIHLVLMAWTVWFLLFTSDLSFGMALAHFVPLGGGLYINSLILEQRRLATRLALGFWLVCATLPWWVASWLLPVGISTALFLIFAAITWVGAAMARHDGPMPNPFEPAS
jgi:hypothetical protein